MIEELDDIIEELADNFGAYGAHTEPENADCECRVCFTTELKSRILRAVAIESALATTEAAK